MGEHFNVPGHSIAEVREAVLKERNHNGSYNVRLLNNLIQKFRTGPPRTK